MWPPCSAYNRRKGGRAGTSGRRRAHRLLKKIMPQATPPRRTIAPIIILAVLALNIVACQPANSSQAFTQVPTPSFMQAITQTPLVGTSEPPDVASPTAPGGDSFLEQIGELEVSSGGLFALSADGTVIATSLLSDGFTTIDAFAVASGELLWSFDKGTAGVIGTTSYAFSSDGSMLAAGGFEQIGHVLDVETGELLYELPMSSFINAVDFSADGRFLAAAASHEKGTVRVWSLDNGSYFDYPERIPALDVAFSPKEPVLAIAQDFLLPHSPGEGGVLLWNLGTGDVATIFAGKPVKAVAISPDGDFLAASVEDAMRLWHFERKAEVEVEKEELVHGSTDIRIVFLEDDVFAVTVTMGNHSVGFQTLIRVWNASGELLGEATLEGQQYIAASRRGYLLTGQYGDPLQIWHVRRPQ
jgi:WD40 repeat protein